MATVTKRLAEFADGLVYFEMDYKDSNMRVTAFRAVNNTDQAAYGQIAHTETGRAYDLRFPPGAMREVTVDTHPARNIQLYMDSKGRLAGFDVSFVWPYP